MTAPREFTGKLTDPAFRHERARAGGRARTTLDYYVRAVAERASDLTREQRDRLLAALQEADR